jgi:hypothetical protein
MKRLQQTFAQAWFTAKAWGDSSANVGALTLSDRQFRHFNVAMLAVLALMITMQVNPVTAFTTPAAGSFGYDFYDVMVNKVANGSIGFVGGLFILVVGLVQVFRGQWALGCTALLAGTGIVKAETILNTLGAIVS